MKTLTPQKRIKRLTSRAFLFLISILIVISIPKLIPSLFYKNKLEYKNYTVYSNSSLETSLSKILDSTLLLTSHKQLNCKQEKYKVFICNSRLLFGLHTKWGLEATGASDYLTNNIYIAFGDLKRNYGTHNKQATNGRTIHSLIAHEQIHIMLREKLGIWNYVNLYKSDSWKIEGLCEWFSFYGHQIDYTAMKNIINEGSFRNNPFHRYWAYRYAVDFLITEGQLNTDDILQYNQSFETVLANSQATD